MKTPHIQKVGVDSSPGPFQCCCACGLVDAVVCVVASHAFIAVVVAVVAAAVAAGFGGASGHAAGNRCSFSGTGVIKWCCC